MKVKLSKNKKHWLCGGVEYDVNYVTKEGAIYLTKMRESHKIEEKNNFKRFRKVLPQEVIQKYHVEDGANILSRVELDGANYAPIQNGHYVISFGSEWRIGFAEYNVTDGYIDVDVNVVTHVTTCTIYKIDRYKNKFIKFGVVKFRKEFPITVHRLETYVKECRKIYALPESRGCGTFQWYVYKFGTKVVGVINNSATSLIVEEV